MRSIFNWRQASVICALAVYSFQVFGQQPDNPAPKLTTSSAPNGQAEQASATAPANALLRLTLQDALERARKNSTQFQAAQTDAAIARQDKFQAGAALLPSVAYNNEALYTQGAPAALANQTG